MSIFQIIATLFALFMIYATRIHKTKLKFSTTETFFWYSLWVSFIIIALFPNLLKDITQLLHIGRIFDLLLVGALMVITIIVVMTHFQQRENNKKLEKLIRKQAIQRAKK